MKAVSARLSKISVDREWWARAVLVTVAGIFVGMFFVTVLPRVSYPYDLDFLEDSVLMESLQVAHGHSVYGPPNADFDPHVYMPLYFWIGGALFWLVGPSLPLLRLVSLAATLATTLLIYWVAQRESGQQWLGLVCAGLYLGGYRINGFWYEVARVDSLFVALLLGGLALAFYAGTSNRRLVASGLVMALAFFTKQTGAVVGAGLALFLLFSLGRRAWYFIIPLGTLTLIPFIALTVLTNGWFYYHVVSVGSFEPIELGRLASYVAFDVFGVMAGVTVLALFATGLGLRQQGLRFLRQQPWLAAILMGIIIGGLGRMRVGGNLNNRMPAYALLCIAPAVVWGGSVLTTTGWQALWARWRSPILTIVLLIQFGLGVYNPLRYIPTAEMRASGQALIARIAAVNGPVLVMMHPYYAVLAGKEPAAQIATLWYVRKRGTDPLPDAFVARLQSGYYAEIISDESSFEIEDDLQSLITTYYKQETVLGESDAPATTTGVVIRPSVVYIPK